MRLNSMKHILLLCTILTLLQPHPSHAHNGAVAIAVPVEGIVVDGDLSDWPEGMTRYEIALPQEGDPLTGKEDFKASFRVGFNEEENALYIAVEVRDESVVITGWNLWDLDGCEISLDMMHMKGIPSNVQLALWGNTRAGVTSEGRWKNVSLEVQRKETHHWYEWRICVAEMSEERVHLSPNLAIGLDIAVTDRDEDGSFSWIAWGRGTGKYRYTDRLGDVFLVRSSNMTLEEARIPLLSNIIEHTVKSMRNNTRKISSYQVFFTAVPFAFSLLHLFFFVFYPRLKENLNYSIFASSVAAYTFVDFQGGFSSIGWSEIISTNIVMVLAGLGFIYSLSYTQLPKRFWIFLLIGLAGMGTSWIDPPTQSSGKIILLYPLLVLVGYLEMLRTCFSTVLREKEGAWILIIGFAFFIALNIDKLLGFLGFSVITTTRFPYHYYWGFLSVILSMSIYLARNYTNTNKNLEAQLVEVKALSEQAIEQERRIRDEEVQRQLFEEELQTAHDMQIGLMPTESPTIQGFDISGRCIPANHVGGDFFQYFPLSDNRLAISLADVTGHAMEAAVPVMMFSGILDTQMETDDSLENLFAKLNRSLHRNLGSRTFVCFTMGELDTSTRILRLSNGGCPYPYHYKSASGEIVELQVDAYPLGVRAKTDYPAIETQLESGDRVVFCSDGIIEAENSSGDIFGFEQTADTIRKGCSQDLSAPQLLDYLINEVKTFTGETPQGDDQTVVILAVEA
jgi:serine phosphatase RsbU (regulator of sigma subunit)